MKAMYIAFVIIAVITVGADFALNYIGFSSQERSASASVRLGDN